MRLRVFLASLAAVGAGHGLLGGHRLPGALCLAGALMLAWGIVNEGLRARGKTKS